MYSYQSAAEALGLHASGGLQRPVTFLVPSWPTTNLSRAATIFRGEGTFEGSHRR